MTKIIPALLILVCAYMADAIHGPVYAQNGHTQHQTCTTDEECILECMSAGGTYEECTRW